MVNIFTSDSPDMERVLGLRYTIPVETDIVSTVFKEGMFDHIICGPGLTADVAGIEGKAKDGRLYLALTPEPEKLRRWYGQEDSTVLAKSTFDSLFICQDGEYAVAVVHPKECGLARMHPDDIRLTSMDCLMRFMKADIGSGIEADGTYVYKPKELEIGRELSIVNRAAVMSKFAQIYLKAYERLGIKISHEAYRKTWKWICAKHFWYTKVNDDIAFSDWVKGLKDEPLTSIM